MQYCRSNAVLILGVSPLRGFPVERRGIGHLVPILCGRRLAELVRLGGGVCPSAGCPVGTVVQLVGPAPTLHGALGGRRASAGYGPASGASVSARPSAGRTRAWWPHRDTTSRWCGAVAESWIHWVLPALLVLASTPRCHASGSSRHSLRRGGASGTEVGGCRATGSRDYATAHAVLNTNHLGSISESLGLVNAWLVKYNEKYIAKHTWIMHVHDNTGIK